MNAYKVYKYTFPDGKIYVGMTKNTIQERRNCGYQHNQMMKDAIRKYGWESVLTEILENNLSYEEACEKEVKYISLFNATDKEIGYNCSTGGSASYKGVKHSMKYRQHMSDLYKGKVFTNETLEKMRNAHKKERKEVSMFSLSGELIISFGCLGEAAQAVGGYKSNISRACINNKAYKGYLWKLGKVVM